MSSIYSNNGYLYYSYSYKDENGKYKRKTESLGLPDTRRARQEAKEIQRAKDRYYQSKEVEKIPTAFLKLEDGLELFLDSKKNRRPKTIQYYKDSQKHIKSFFNCNRYVTSFKVNDFTEFEYYLKNLGLSKYSVNTYMRAAKILFQFFCEREYIVVNPVKYKREKPKVKHVATEEEIEKVLAGVADNDLHYFLVKFLILTGFRISEVIAIRWEDIYWDEKLIRVTNVKAGRDDKFPLYEELYNLLAPRRKEEGQIFPLKNTDSCKYLGKKIKRYAKISFHDFRRYFGTKYAKKLTQAELQKLMRHDDPSTTSKYYINLEIADIGLKM